MLELEDFDAFLEDSFDPLKFAASLLAATNVSDDSELDLGTPVKKLQFDAHEVEKRMEKIAAANHMLLVDNFSKIESTRALLAAHINPLTLRVKKAFERIHTDVIQPYDDAVTLNSALKRVHATLALLRGAGFFFVFVQQLQECEKAVESLSDNRDMVRLAKLHQQVGDVFQSSPDLLSLKVVRDYQPIFLAKTAQLVSDVSTSVLNDLGHHSTFAAANEHLQHNVVALYILDSSELYSALDKGAMSKSIQVALTSLTRSLQSPRNFGSVLAEVNQSSAMFASTLADLLDNCHMPEAPRTSLLHEFVQSLEGPSIENEYWARLAYKFKKNLAATMARGGPIARNLRSHYSSMVDSIEKGLEDPARLDMLDAVALINSHAA